MRQPQARPRFSKRAPQGALSLVVLLIVAAIASPGRERFTPPVEAASQQFSEVLSTPPANAFQSVIRPMAEQAARARAERWRDPAALARVDTELSANRINFLLFGHGETHEPPLTERAFIGSYTIASYDLVAGKIDFVSFTHDIRSPEIERAVRARGQERVTPIRIDRAYHTGGFDLSRETIENATGLAIDYQVAFDDGALAVAIDRVFGGVPVDVPATFQVNAFYLRNVKYPAATFQKGPQQLTGAQVLQFIKTVPVEHKYDKDLEHNARKHRVMRALMDSLRARATDPGFWWTALGFFNGETSSGGIAYDFDVPRLVGGSLGQVLLAAGHLADTDSSGQSSPEPRHSVYVVDIMSGDGGVQWVKADAHENPITRRDVDSGLYVDLAMEVPVNSDPYAENLAAGYWGSVRRLVRQRLTSHLAPLPSPGVSASPTPRGALD